MNAPFPAPVSPAARLAADAGPVEEVEAMSEPDGRTPRDDLPPLQRAVSDALDDYLSRKLGVISSSSDWDLFLWLLREEGYEVTAVEAPAGRPESRRQT